MSNKSEKITTIKKRKIILILLIITFSLLPISVYSMLPSHIYNSRIINSNNLRCTYFENGL